MSEPVELHVPHTCQDERAEDDWLDWEEREFVGWGCPACDQEMDAEDENDDIY